MSFDELCYEIFIDYLVPHTHTHTHTHTHLQDLLLWVGVRRRPSSVMRRPLTFSDSSSHELLGQSSINLICSFCREGRQEIVYFMTPTPRGGNFGVKSVKFMYNLNKSSSLQTGVWFRQTNNIVIMTKEGSTKIVNFMTPRAGVFVLGRISHIVKMHFFF